MSVGVLDPPRATVQPRARRRRPAANPQPSTSIRVSVATRDKLAALAKQDGLSLSAFMDGMVRRAERQKIFAEFRTALVEAFADPAYRAEMQEWEEADDGVDFDDDGWPEYNGR